VHSAIPGKDGEILFSGDDGLLNALGFTTIISSQESVFHVDVYEAHKNQVIAKNVNISGNLLAGVVQPGVDVKFAPNTATLIQWNDETRSLEWIAAPGRESIYLHISYNALTLHVGANQLQDVILSIGEFSSESLGVHNVILMSNAHANAAIAKCDGAIDRVSKTRAMLGASHNRLSHTVESLTAASENMTASESRIRDADMAKFLLDYTKLDILSNAASAMLAQANALPQLVLQLLR
jgi:flagellin